MSHYTDIRLEMSDRESLVSALHDLDVGIVEVHDSPQPMHGYDGQVRHAEVILRRAGYLENDVGFLKGGDGTYAAVLDDYDVRHEFTPEWQQRLLQRYARHTAVAKLRKKGFRVLREETRDGRLHLVMGRTR